VRIAFNCTGENGVRAIKALLTDASVESIGIWKSNPSLPHDRRIGPITDLLGYEVLVTDDPSVGQSVADTVDARIPLVTAADDMDKGAIAEALIEAQVPGLVGSNLRAGLVHALLVELRSRFDEVLEESLSWTEPGRPLRRGHAAEFPNPTGPLWAKPSSSEWFPAGHVKLKRFMAPQEDRWAAASVTVSGFVNDGVVSRTVGISDDRKYLEAIALASGALAMAKHGLPAGMWWTGDFSDAYLDAARTFGLATAHFERTGRHERTT
jgi:hypothetical protein